MQILGIILIVYGVLCLAGFLLKFPFIYNNAKSKALIKMMGKTGYDILLIVFGLTALIIGILLV